jgi:hypothetical protein
VSEKNLNTIVTKSVVLHTVNLREAAEHILKQSGLSDWTVEADSHPLFNVRMVTCSLEGDVLVNVLGKLANFYIATFHYVKEHNQVVFLPHVAYRETLTMSYVEWDDILA